jgi:hypothetical protein
MARDLEINDGRPTSDKPEDFSPEYKTGFRDGRGDLLAIVRTGKVCGPTTQTLGGKLR